MSIENQIAVNASEPEVAECELCNSSMTLELNGLGGSVGLLVCDNNNQTCNNQRWEDEK